MKQIEIEGKKYFYEVYPSVNPFGFLEYETVFYQKEETVKERRWKIFGKFIEKKVPIVLFSIHANANDPTIPRSWWVEKIYNHIAILSRKEELNEGNLI